MSNIWKDANKNNLGNFKTKLINKQKTTIDHKSMVKVINELETNADSLFLPLNKGIRYPSIMTAKIYYDSTADAWGTTDVYGQVPNFISDVTASLDGTVVDYLDVILNAEETVALTDTTPLFFINNLYYNSTAPGLPDNQLLFPRVEEIITDMETECTCRLSIEGPSDTSGWADPSFGGLAGAEGLAFQLEALFQTTEEAGDVAFFVYDTPYFSGYSLTIFPNKITGTVNILSDLVGADATGLDVYSKVRLKAQPWVGDCTTGAASPIHAVFGDWDANYQLNPHSKMPGTLTPSTKYKLYGIIDLDTGRDQMDWQPILCFTTPTAGGGPVVYVSQN